MSLIESLTPEEIANYKDAFAIFDKNGDGTISVNEIGTVMRSLNMSPTEAELHELVGDLDSNNNGSINFSEFVTLVLKRGTHVDSVEDIREAFKVFDRENTGYANVAELRHVLTSIGERLTKGEVEEFLKEVNIGENGMIKIEELVMFLTGIK